jgi:hypothetical protein
LGVETARGSENRIVRVDDKGQITEENKQRFDPSVVGSACLAEPPFFQGDINGGHSVSELLLRIVR